jgi:hypothetical protein
MARTTDVVAGSDGLVEQGRNLRARSRVVERTHDPPNASPPPGGRIRLLLVADTSAAPAIPMYAPNADSVPVPGRSAGAPRDLAGAATIRDVAGPWRIEAAEGGSIRVHGVRECGIRSADGTRIEAARLAVNRLHVILAMPGRARGRGDVRRRDVTVEPEVAALTVRSALHPSVVRVRRRLATGCLRSDRIVVSRSAATGAAAGRRP